MPARETRAASIKRLFALPLLPLSLRQPLRELSSRKRLRKQRHKQFPGNFLRHFAMPFQVPAREQRKQGPHEMLLAARNGRKKLRARKTRARAMSGKRSGEGLREGENACETTPPVRAPCHGQCTARAQRATLGNALKFLGLISRKVRFAYKARDCSF